MIVLAVAIVAATVIVINSSSKLFIVFYLKKGLGPCGLIEVAYQNCVLSVVYTHFQFSGSFHFTATTVTVTNSSSKLFIVFLRKVSDRLV